MTRAELRTMTGRRLAQLGYSRQHYTWHPWRALLYVLVGTEIVQLHLPTSSSKRHREREWARVSRRGPAIRLITHKRDDGFGEQLDLAILWGEVIGHAYQA